MVYDVLYMFYASAIVHGECCVHACALYDWIAAASRNTKQNQTLSVLCSAPVCKERLSLTLKNLPPKTALLYVVNTVMSVAYSLTLLLVTWKCFFGG